MISLIIIGQKKSCTENVVQRSKQEKPEHVLFRHQIVKQYTYWALFSFSNFNLPPGKKLVQNNPSPKFLSIEKGPAMARSIENTKASLCSLGSGNDQTERTVVTSPRQIVNGFLTTSKNCALPFWQSIISSRKVPGKTTKIKQKYKKMLDNICTV